MIDYFPRVSFLKYKEMLNDGTIVIKQCSCDKERKCLHKDCKYNTYNFCQADRRVCIDEIKKFLNELDE